MVGGLSQNNARGRKRDNRYSTVEEVAEKTKMDESVGKSWLVESRDQRVSVPHVSAQDK